MTEERKGLQDIIFETIEQVQNDICDNYCKYRETADEDLICDAIRNGDGCPLDRLL